MKTLTMVMIFIAGISMPMTGFSANKTELIDLITKETGLDRDDVRKTVDSFLGNITQRLASGDQVTLAGFGTFLVRDRAARTGRNPQTGETINIPASKVPSFKSGKALKDAVN
jgi:DNA-binding protein HU-beta